MKAELSKIQHARSEKDFPEIDFGLTSTLRKKAL
jgi:hypothetical protein